MYVRPKTPSESQKLRPKSPSESQNLVKSAIFVTPCISGPKSKTIFLRLSNGVSLESKQIVWFW